MGKYNWIDGKDFSIDCFYLMDRWLLQMIIGRYEDKDLEDFSDHDRTLAALIALKPSLQWVISQRAPETKGALENLLKAKEDINDASVLRQREIVLMEALETDVVYTAPEIMASACNYITAWKEERLHALTDLTGKVVLDVGAGTGRLTFAAAKKAKRVYASEPVDMLREHMRDRIKEEGLNNVKVLDGIVTNLPYEDDTFDTVICGHVIGDYYDEEIGELTRVTKAGGEIVVCNGDDDIVRSRPDKAMTDRGFEVFHHKSSIGGDIYNYRKEVKKQ